MVHSPQWKKLLIAAAFIFFATSILMRAADNYAGTHSATIQTVQQRTAMMSSDNLIQPARTQATTVGTDAQTCMLGDFSMSEHLQWWGRQYYVNDCLIYWFNPAHLLAIGGVSVLAIATCAAAVICGAVAATTLVYIAVTYELLNHDTSACSHRGAYINVPVVGLPWPSPVC